tara:strand:- start:2212 stop:3468 length:1257 start_codon:yes stop_codon:yes gene_type:complete
MLWNNLEHNGIQLIPLHKKLNVKMVYNNKAVDLNREAEEAAIWYANVDNKIKDSVFKQNFWNGWKKLLGPGTSIKNLNSCNFKHFIGVKRTTNLITNPRYGWCKINGVLEKAHNYVEHPGIFVGRGTHPLRGTIKPRIYEHDITLNGSKVPKGSWKIIENQEVSWIASWIDKLNKKTKYIYPLNVADEKQKFDLARKLKRNLKQILKHNESSYSNECALATEIINTFVIRVGNEKGDDEVDTVGCCTLKRNNLYVSGLNLTLEFKGKDSIPYKRTVKMKSDFITALHKVLVNKSKDDFVFKINSSSLNNYLNKLLPGLSAKVFRTCHSSACFNKFVKHYSKSYNSIESIHKANEKVAILCNHKRKNKTSLTTSKTNYIDPRIIISFCKKHDLKPQNIYSPSQLAKHSWAMCTSTDFSY